jgi:hypothetical protein
VPLNPERQVNADARFYTLRSLGLDAKTANEVSIVLEFRCMCHERVGGVEVIYDEMWMEPEAYRWASLYRRAVAHLEPKHVERLRAVLDRLAVSVP